ncbi:MAG: hypothetical protein ABWY11_10325 [Umezawaea sp.]
MNRFRIARALQALALTAVFTASAAGTATAGVPDTPAMTPDVGVQSAPTEIPNFQTGMYLDDSFEYGLRAIEPNGGSYQKWWVTVWSDNTRELKNYVTGRCVEANDGGGVFAAKSCTKSRLQSWEFVANYYFEHYHYFAMENQQNGCALDHSGQYGLRCITYYGNGYQAWNARDTS